MNTLKAGDLVVCVDASPDLKCPVTDTGLRERRTYRVAKVTDLGLRLGVELEGVPAPTPCAGTSFRGFRPERFEKVGEPYSPADPEFTRQLRTMRRTVPPMAPRRGTGTLPA